MISRPLDKLLDILVPQYQDSTNFIEYLTIFSEQMQEIHIALEETKTERYLENAIGEQLETIGIIVGLKRGTFLTAGGVYFGFTTVIGASPFGTSSVVETSGFFKSISDPEHTSTLLGDAEYKSHIEAKIIKNFKSITVETTIEVVRAVLGSVEVHLTESTLAFNVDFPFALTSDQKLLISTPGVVPKPLGINVTFSDTSGPFVN